MRQPEHDVTDHDLANLFYDHAFDEATDPRVTAALAEAMMQRGLLSRA